jgi:ferrochelatase
VAVLKRVLILLNLGTPDDPGPDAVGRYLREFLMDERVIDLPWPVRWFLVNCVIVPRRRYTSSELYRKIWSENGSPLLVHLQNLAEGLRLRLSAHGVDQEFEIEIAMRYGSPSIPTVFEKIRARGYVTEIVVFPLYPQYAESTTLSSIEECQRVARERDLNFSIKFVEPFFEHRGFVEPMAGKITEIWHREPRERPEHLLMSFHGLPERHVKRTDLSRGMHCLVKEDCCDEMVAANRDCYRAQCFASARAIAIAAGLAPNEYSVAFQSRLGRAVWIGPSTEDMIAALAKRGMRHLAVACPSFVADCLETIEEIGNRGAEIFHANGGESFTRIDCLNSDAAWVEGALNVSEAAFTK